MSDHLIAGMPVSWAYAQHPTLFCSQAGVIELTLLFCCHPQVMADAEFENSKLPGLISEALVLKRKQRLLGST